MKLIPKVDCLQCNKTLWRENPNPPHPKAGENVICIYCGYIIEIDENLNATEPTGEISNLIIEGSNLIKSLNINGSNPFNGQPDRFNLRDKLGVVFTCH